MLVDVVSVSREDRPSSNGKGTYGSLTVTYRSNGKIAEKKLMSFTNPSVFKHFESAKQGDVVEVTTNKNDKGFWDWTGIGVPSSAAPAGTATPASSVTSKATGSTYETKEERAVKQRYIVRQSSIASAIASLSAMKHKVETPDDIIKIAKEFEAYVFSFEEKPALDTIVDDLESDIPY